MAAPQASPEKQLVWRFNDHDHDSAYSLAAINTAHLSSLIKKLGDFESMTITALFAPNSEHGKNYTVESLPAEAQKLLESSGHDDETQVARLRLTGKQRLYGFLRENVFHVLWWDPEHQIYPSKKRHT